MELECAKHGEKTDAAQTVCRHPGDYCQHRKACMIQFVERENTDNETQRMSRTQDGKVELLASAH